MTATVIEELAVLLGFDVDQPGLSAAIKSYTDLHNLAIDLVEGFKAIGEALIEPIRKVTELGTEAVKMSLRLGTSVEGFQELNEAAKLAGVGTEELVHGMQHLARSAYEATTGHKEQALAFSRLGVQLHDSNGKLKTSDVLLEDMARGMERIQDPSKRTALAFQVMGRGAGALIPLLVQGVGKLDEFKQIARDSGLILSEETAQSAKALGLEYKVLSLQTEGLIRRLGTGLVPIARSVVSTMLQWWRVNREFINQKLDQVIGAVTRAVQPLYDAVRVLWSVVTNVVNLFGGWQNILYAIAGLIAFRLVAAFGEFTATIGSATKGLIKFFTTMLVGEIPFFLLGAAIIGTIALIALVVQDLESSDSAIKRFINEGENPNDTPLIKWFKIAIDFARALGKEFQGLYNIGAGTVLGAIGLVTGNEKLKGQALRASQQGFGQLTGEEVSREGSLSAIDARERAANFVGPLRQVNAAPFGAFSSGSSVSSTSTATSTINLTQNFNGPADPARVKDATVQGVGRAQRDVDEDRRKQTYNSGGRAGYR